MRIHERLLVLLILTAVSNLMCAQGTKEETQDIIKSPSPDGHFALRISSTIENGTESRNAELIEKASSKVLIDMGAPGHLDETILVWSADSKRVAYATRFEKEGETHVYFLNGSAFEEVDLPDDLPGPEIKVPKNAGDVKNYGGADKPLRWSKSGDLEMSSDLMLLSRDNGKTYTGVVHYTIAFDAQHHASVKNVGKTITRVED
jgi:hypothetical protein